MSDDPYLYPGSDVLRNRLGLRDTALLDHHERELVVQRIRQGVPAGRFDVSKEANYARYDAMARCFDVAIVSRRA